LIVEGRIEWLDEAAWNCQIPVTVERDAILVPVRIALKATSVFARNVAMFSRELTRWERIAFQSFVNALISEEAPA